MKQVRHMLALWFALCVSSDFPAISIFADEVPTSPNVLMIAVDDLSDYVSVLQNHSGIKTPNFDRLAKRSVNFTRAYCAAPICNPSRVAVMTGMAPHQTGVYQLGDRMSRSKPALAAVALEENFKRHGYHIGEKEWLHRRALWTQTTRVPFLISVPGMETAGENCTAPVSLVDIYPTLDELCQFNQNVPQKLAGHSLTPLLKSPSHDWPHVAVTSHGEGNAAVTDVRYHFIRYADGSEKLYDHQTDPREFNNLASKPESQPIVRRLSASLPKTWVRSGRKRDNTQ